MKNLFFTILVVPDRKGTSLRMRLHRRSLYALVISALVLFSILSSLLVHYLYILGQEFEARALRAENLTLKRHLKTVEKKMGAVEQRLATLNRLDEKLRALTALADQDRGIAMGPIPNADTQSAAFIDPLDPFSSTLPSGDLSLSSLQNSLLDSRLHGLAEETQRQLTSLSELVDYFGVQKTLLASTPSIWPSIGWVTSNFGPRADPYTGNQVMHVGVDIAAREGTQVVAPAAGRVVFSGNGGAYGNMVAIDHGRGLVTHFGHLSQSLVKIGDFVKRGDRIALIGNTGRSTGPHLHYEVRQGGLPVNPRRFIVY
jgi:murein DD-endopeptidase MepM/ murein hydrolase activator NlpD